jgi:hypothetical protein
MVEPMSDAEVQQFLDELTELCHRHGLGIAGPFDLFVTEADDCDRKYREDGRGKYEFF